MKTIYLPIILFLLSISSGFGQTSEVRQSMGMGAFSVGYGNMDVSNMHKFVPANTKSFDNNHFVIGGEGHAIINRIVIGGQGYGMQGNSLSTDNTNINLSGGLGTFDMGYVIMDRATWKLYPVLGLGGGSYGIRIYDNKNVPLSELNNSNTYHSINISQSYFVADLSLNLNFFPFISNEAINSGNYGGFLTGIKVGYVYSLPGSKWNYGGGDVTGGPDFGLNMFYVKVLIGGFGCHRETVYR